VPNHQLERILGIDPGSSVTGWCVIDITGAVIAAGDLTRTKRGKTTWPDILEILDAVMGKIAVHKPKYVAIEDYVYMGKARGMATMCKLVGALAGNAHGLGCHVRFVKPKEKGKKKKPRRGWSQHAQDALQVAKLLLPPPHVDKGKP